VKIKPTAIPVFLFAISLFSFAPGNKAPDGNIKFPWKRAGLTEQQAAAHLLSRFTYGYTPEMVDKVLKTGLEKWFLQQLAAQQNDDSLNIMLNQFEAIGMTNGQVAARYSEPGKFVKMAVAEGVISKEQVAELKEEDKRTYRRLLLQYMEKKGVKPKDDLNRQLISQKIIRATYSKNQLLEVMTAFWFNHFNVSLTKTQSNIYTLPYERDIIRPHALGHFEDLLIATAKSPAMLLYLDNDKSRVDEEHATATRQRMQKRPDALVQQKQQQDTSMQKMEAAVKAKASGKQQGLNENYAREVMELHTVGVDGGYSQADVTEGARILTGWMMYPLDSGGLKGIEKLRERFSEEQLAEKGFVHEGDFLFAANRHDFGTKQFFGKSFPAGRGYQEGLELLQTLAAHPSTAKFISKKLAARFVQDEPPASLVNRMAETFIKTSGDIKAVLITMVSSPEFWSKEAYRQKIKSPFELVVSALRVTNSKVSDPYPLYRWLQQMGEPMYSYQAPTGFPDRANFWVNTGSLLYRMNFGLALATGKMDGVSYDEGALNKFHEPESMEAALKTYGALLMPGRDLSAGNQKLLKLLQDPAIVKKIETAASNTKPNVEPEHKDGLMDDNLASKKITTINPSTIRQVIGILLGSPEFQRR
jgi:uncharacterized protein (DUF1800 family)